MSVIWIVHLNVQEEVDKTIHFDYCGKKQIKLMYDKFVKTRQNNFDTFYKEIKPFKTTTAMLQKYFLKTENRKLSKKILKILKKLQAVKNMKEILIFTAK